MKAEQEIRKKIKEFLPTSQEVNHFDPNVNDKSTRLYKFTDDKGLKFKLWIFTNRIKLETPLTTSLLFSINLPDKICLANKLVKEMPGVGKIFTDNSKDDQIQSCVILLRDDLKSLHFEDTEGLTVYRNSLQMTLKKARLMLPEIEACRKMKAKIELNYPDKIYKADYSDLPSDLKQLVVKFEHWAISDDFERDEKIKVSTKKERTDLVTEIEPKLDEINSFLNTFGDIPLPDGAIKIQCLAEVVMEMKFAK